MVQLVEVPFYSSEVLGGNLSCCFYTMKMIGVAFVKEKIQVVLGDANELWQEQLKQSFAASPNIHLLGSTNNGYELIHLVKMAEPDMLVLDVVLLHLDGLRVLQEVKKLSKPPLSIVVSSFEQEELIAEAGAQGAGFFLRKPIDAQVLISRIEELFAQRSKMGIVGNSSPGFEKELMRAITDALREMAMLPNVSGYHYLRESIFLAAKQPEYLHSKMTSKLYLAVAKHFNIRPAKVERDMRYAIEGAWNRSSPEAREKYFGKTIGRSLAKPNNSEFIAALADRFYLELKAY